MNRWRLVPLGAASIVLATAIAFAAGGGPSMSPDERFAASVCAVQAETYAEILDVHDAVVHTRATPGEDGWAYVVAHTDRAHAIMQKYTRRIRAIEIPDTADGRRVARFMADFTRIPLSHTTRALRRINSFVPKDMTLVQNIRALNDLERDLVLVRGELFGGGLFITPNLGIELFDEFERAESCRTIGKQMGAEPRN